MAQVRSVAEWIHVGICPVPRPGARPCSLFSFSAGFSDVIGHHNFALYLGSHRRGVWGPF